MPILRVKVPFNDSKKPLDSLCAPPHVGHYSDSGGWQPIPAMLPQEQHVCFMEGPKLLPPYQGPVS